MISAQEESLLQIVSGTYDPKALLKNLSDQDICSDSKDLIDSERNAVDLYDQRDSKGQDLEYFGQNVCADTCAIERAIYNSAISAVYNRLSKCACL